MVPARSSEFSERSTKQPDQDENRNCPNPCWIAFFGILHPMRTMSMFLNLELVTMFCFRWNRNFPSEASAYAIPETRRIKRIDPIHCLPSNREHRYSIRSWSVGLVMPTSTRLPGNLTRASARLKLTRRQQSLLGKMLPGNLTRASARLPKRQPSRRSPESCCSAIIPLTGLNLIWSGCGNTPLPHWTSTR